MTTLTGALRHSKSHRRAVSRSQQRVKWRPIYDPAMVSLLSDVLQGEAMLRKHLDEACGIRVLPMGFPGGVH